MLGKAKYEDRFFLRVLPLFLACHPSTNISCLQAFVMWASDRPEHTGHQLSVHFFTSTLQNCDLTNLIYTHIKQPADQCYGKKKTSLIA